MPNDKASKHMKQKWKEVKWIYYTLFSTTNEMIWWNSKVVKDLDSATLADTHRADVQHLQKTHPFLRWTWYFVSPSKLKRSKLVSCIFSDINDNTLETNLTASTKTYDVIKTTMKCHFTRIRVATIKKKKRRERSTRWRGCGEKLGNLCTADRTVRGCCCHGKHWAGFSKKLKTGLPRDTAIALLGI